MPQCEMEISNAWVVPESDQKQLETRAEAAKDISTIARRLSVVETELIQKIRESEESVPTCHPAP